MGRICLGMCCRYVATPWETRGKKRQKPLGLNASPQKKVLSLVLCVAVMLSVMVLGAGAAFSDQADIENTEAVEMATALNIIDGYEDGSYHPERNIKRSEMCKMICIALNGGKVPATSTKDDPTFTDIDGHWAEGYIEYCYTKGVVSGVGEGRFNPDGNVTVTQAAKMLLVALGYNAEVEQFVGSNWSLYVNVKANQDGLYKDLEGIDTADAITRDEAAQMVWNTMQAKVIEKTSSIDVTTGDVTESYKKGEDTMLKDGYNATIYEGVLQASGDYAYNSADPTKTAGKEKLNIRAEYQDGDAITAADITLNCTTDYTALLGEYTKVVYSNKDKEVLGAFAVEDENYVVETTMGLVDEVTAGDKEITVDGATYDLSFTAAGTDTNVYGNGANDDFISTFTGDSSADVVKLISNNGDEKIDIALIVPVALYKVAYVGSNNITLSAENGAASIGNVKTADCEISGDLAVDDYVAVTDKGYSFANKYTVAKADMVEGKVTEIKQDGTATTDVLVDGTWYTLLSGLTDDASAQLAVDNTYKLALINGYVYDAEKVTGASTKLAIITGKTNTTDFDGYVQARMMLTDGTEVTGYMMEYGQGKTDALANVDVGDLVAYEMDGELYDLYLVGKTYDGDADSVASKKATAGYTVDGFTNGTADSAIWDESESELNGRGVNDSAVVFVWYDSDLSTAGMQDAFKVISGEELNAWNSDWGTNAGGLYSDTGLGWYDVAVVKGAAGDAVAGTTTNYAFVTSSISKGTDYVSYSIWDGKSESAVQVKEMKTSTVATKGGVISFDWDGDGVIKNVKSATSTTGAIEYSNGKQVKIDGTAYNLADDVVILNVDTAKNEGVAGSTIGIAQKDTSGLYFDNAYYVYDATDKEIDLLVIDVINNKLSIAGQQSFSSDATADQINAALAAGSDAIVVGNLTLKSTDTIDLTSGTTLTVQGTLTLGAAMPTASGGTLAAGKIDATALTTQNETNIGTLLGYTDDVVAGTIDLSSGSLAVGAGKTLTAAAVTGSNALTATAGTDASDPGATIVVTGNVANNVVANAYSNVTVGTVGGTIDSNANSNVTITGALKASSQFDGDVEGTVTLQAAQAAASLEAITGAATGKLIIAQNSNTTTTNISNTGTSTAKFFSDPGTLAASDAVGAAAAVNGSGNILADTYVWDTTTINAGQSDPTTNSTAYSTGAWLAE